ncbi:MAG: hypothetical protein ACLFRP_03650 [Puniceicoccaceae bacterium]
MAASLVLLAATACKPSGGDADDGRSQVLRAFPETAEIAMYFDQGAMSDSAFSKAVEAMQEDLPEAEATDEMSDRIEEITGLENGDITEFVLAVSGLEDAGVDPSAVKLSSAIHAAKPVTAEQIVQLVSYLAEENGESVELTVTVGEGVDYIEFPEDDELPDLYAAVVTGESWTTVFFGDKPSVEASLARETGSVPAALKAPSDGLLVGEQGWISVILPESVRAQLPQFSAMAEQMAPQMGPGLSKINSLESLGVAFRTGDALDMAVGFNLGSEEDAEAVTAVLNNQLISFAKVMVSGGTPEPLDLLNSLSAAQSEDSAVLSLTMTVEDLKQLQTQMLDFFPGGGMGPMGVPGQ